MRPPFNLAMVERATVVSMRGGHRLFQTHRYASDDLAHVQVLLDVLDPPRGALVLDAGCGIGEVSRLMAQLRPDLRFVMTNISELQLSFCPRGAQFSSFRDDCHAMRFDDGLFDAVMFSSALCQMDAAVALGEAARVLRPGGSLLVNDMAREVDDHGVMEALLAARLLRPEILLAVIKNAGFDIDRVETPTFDDGEFRTLLMLSGLQRVLDGVSPVLIRASRKGVS